jgi:hypothetical protein
MISDTRGEKREKGQKSEAQGRGRKEEMRGRTRKGTEGWVKPEEGQPGIFGPWRRQRGVLSAWALPHPASRSHMLGMRF